MRSAKLSPRAKSDIDQIWNFTAARWGVDQAEIYIRQIQAAVETIAASPGLGKACDEVRVGYRKFPAGSHLLFYKLTADAIEIIRILHHSMNFNRHL